MSRLDPTPQRRTRCAVYTRKSTEEGLEQPFNSIDAQKESGHAYIVSRRSEGWIPIADDYDDPAYSGGSMERPALQRLFSDIESGKVDVVVVYKLDRLSRSLADFCRMIEVFDRHSVSFVSVTQSFNTGDSMGRLMLNVLLSFAQFEREVTGERIRDKIAASKAKGMWMGGVPPLGLTDALLATSLLGYALAISVWGQLGLTKQIAWGALRSFLQTVSTPSYRGGLRPLRATHSEESTLSANGAGR